MTRAVFIERLIRQYYGGQPTDDAQLTPNLVNTWVNEGVALAARQNYKDNQQVEGVGYNSDGFSIDYTNLSVTADPFEVGKNYITLPDAPLGIGENEGVKTMRLVNKSFISSPVILISIRESDFVDSLPKPDGVFAWYVGSKINLYSPIYPNLTDFKAKVTMISAGNSSDLTSQINVPNDYLPVVNDYVFAQLTKMKMSKPDTANDGNDIA